MFGIGDIAALDTYGTDPSVDPSAADGSSWVPNEKLKALGNDPNFTLGQTPGGYSMGQATMRAPGAPAAYQMGAALSHPISMFQVMQPRRGR